jgi:serralysin
LIPGAFTFVENDPFTAANQVRIVETANGSSIVQINTDSDFAAEAEIWVANALLAEDDFIL